MAVCSFTSHLPLPLILFFPFLSLRQSHVFCAAISHKHFLLFCLCSIVISTTFFQRHKFKAPICLTFFKSNGLPRNMWMSRSHYKAL
ncbi:hypothetical protein AOQ84DRAFT_355725 [Glonium stellatum]|uniref:Uncharacterized protein n=1 Tax=Glonium stellatum TaxID=574774 RepID=A0A8E2JR25_9PEZI|nr:hypothetical protein AOQ84DRAFT_355725 [Glonium stellatum]